MMVYNVVATSGTRCETHAHPWHFPQPRVENRFGRRCASIV